MLFAGAMAILTCAAVGDLSPRSCEQHRGPFGDGFSPGYDINKIECRAGWTSNSPKLTLWSVSPYASIEW
jgi:hypothetical protein